MGNSDHASQTIGGVAPEANLEGVEPPAPRGPDVSFGYAVASFDVKRSERRTAILRDCTAITPEYELKWDAVQCGIEEFDFSRMDVLADFAKSHQLELHGHTLCWHRSIPKDCQRLRSREFCEAFERYMANALKRYKGAMRSWHVVNEPLDEDQPHGLRCSPFTSAYGQGYIQEMFSFAASADPTARLVLNEMGLEYGSANADLKRKSMLDLLTKLTAAGTPVHCLGIQSHLNATDFRRDDHRAFSRFLEEVRSAGITTMITELDVDDRGIEGDEAVRDKVVAETYREFISLVGESSALVGVNLWGISDDRSWLNQTSVYPMARPLALDGQLRRKPAWQAVQDVLHELE